MPVAVIGASGDREVSGLTDAPDMRNWGWADDFEPTARAGALIIGSAVRDARLRLGLSQRQLAWRSRLAQSTISRLETGRLKGMRLRTLAGIIGVLRASPNFRRPDEPPRPKRRLPGQPSP